MTDDGTALVRQLAEEVVKRLGDQFSLPPIQKPPGVHYTELPEDTSGRAGALEWNTYRREIGRLLAEGHEGRFVLIKGEEILGFFDTWDDARLAGLKRFLREVFLVQEVRTTEPYVRIRGINFP
jgi:hypothetical protein